MDISWEEYKDKLYRSRLDWQNDSACRSIETAKMYPSSEKNQGVVAETICAPCPVRLNCLVYALAYDEQFGVWGGTTEKERAKFQKELKEFTTLSVRRKNLESMAARHVGIAEVSSLAVQVVNA